VKLEPLPLSEHDESKLKALLPGSPLQAFIHNELVRQILVERDKLESCPPESILPLQLGIRLRREMLGYIHRFDKPTNVNSHVH
jgi:hypothetical protein